MQTFKPALFLAVILLFAGGLAAQGGTFKVQTGDVTVTVTLAQSDDNRIVLYNGVLQPGATWDKKDGDGDGDADDYVVTDGAGIAIAQDAADAGTGDTGNVLDGAAPGNPVAGTWTKQ